MAKRRIYEGQAVKIKDLPNFEAAYLRVSRGPGKDVPTWVWLAVMNLELVDPPELDDEELLRWARWLMHPELADTVA